MSPRDSDLAKLAGLRGWRIINSPTGRDFYRLPDEAVPLLPIPAPDAPLGEQMAFVGRIAEALGPQSIRFVRMIPVPTVSFNRDGMEPVSGHAPDLAWAACRAAIAAREGGTDAS